MASGPDTVTANRQPNPWARTLESAVRADNARGLDHYPVVPARDVNGRDGSGWV
jgi:hypothetical protein